MILTGKAKEDFEEWYWNVWLEESDRALEYHDFNKAIEKLWKAQPIYLYSLIITRFDSINIHIDIVVYPECNGDIDFSFTIYGYKYFESIFTYNTREEATRKAILRANKIYNK